MSTYDAHQYGVVFTYVCLWFGLYTLQLSVHYFNNTGYI